MQLLEHVAWRRPRPVPDARGAAVGAVARRRSQRNERRARRLRQRLVETGAGDEVREAPRVVRLDERRAHARRVRGKAQREVFDAHAAALGDGRDRDDALEERPSARRGFVEETEARGRDAACREPAARERGPREHADAARRAGGEERRERLVQGVERRLEAARAGGDRGRARRVALDRRAPRADDAARDEAPERLDERRVVGEVVGRRVELVERDAPPPQPRDGLGRRRRAPRRGEVAAELGGHVERLAVRAEERLRGAVGVRRVREAHA